MTDLAADAIAPAAATTGDPAGTGDVALDVTAFVRRLDGDAARLDLIVDGVRCGGCVAKVERLVRGLPGVTDARQNLTTKRLAVAWTGDVATGNRIVETLGKAGFTAAPFDQTSGADPDAARERDLLRALAVAGFGAANVMLLSVGVWAGHAHGMGDATRDLLHWFSALIALPTIAFAGRPFFASAWSALSHGRTNMDVPISLAVVLAPAVSLAETMRGGHHAYFDSAVMLLFFLLVGRFLDGRARGKARSVVAGLLALRTRSVTMLDEAGRAHAVRPEAIETGATVLIAPGEKIAVDGEVEAGASTVDTALLTGEPVPRDVGPGARVFAGTVNLSGPLRVTVTGVGDRTILGDIVRAMESAEQGKARYVALADRVSRAYAPAVHTLALLAFFGWWLAGGLGWAEALLIATAVLIITCPCALGLAVPAVQVVASGRLFRSGVLLKSGTVLERLVGVDTVVFDKTGTLTRGRPELRCDPTRARDALDLAAGLAGTSRHPLARALVRAAPGRAVLAKVAEVPGRGLEWDGPEGRVRLGSRDWCGVTARDDVLDEGLELWLARPGLDPVRFAFDDPPRADAAETVAALKARGLDVRLLSGDRPAAVAAMARRLDIDDWQASATPDAKLAALQGLAAEGRRVLMVGDGLNDAPALAAAHASLSPGSAADVSQLAADAVFQGDRLGPVITTLDTARAADRLVRENFVLAIVYNAIAVPLAMAGLVTPLIAAVAMSSSSILVVGNALRLSRGPER